MSTFGISENGYNVKRLADIRSSLQTRLAQLKDPDTGESLQVNWDEDDPMIQILNALCDELSANWQLSFENYSQFNPLLATDASLSGLVQLNGIVRKKGSPSSVVLKFTGEVGAQVPLNTRVTDENAEVIWSTSVATTINSEGEATVTAYSETNGAYSFVAGTINTFVVEIDGLQAVVNTDDSVAGVADETDYALRVRRDKATETPSIGIAESIYGGLMNLNGVTYVKIYCNREKETNELGIPGKSIACIVIGGDNEAIAKQLFMRSGACTGFYGSTAVTFVDSMQIATTIRFSRPIEKAIDVKVVVAPIEGSEFPDNYETAIKENIVKYATGGPSALGISGDSFDDFGFPPAETVVVSRLYIPVMAVKGIKIVSMQIALHGEALGVDDIVIDWNCVALFDSENILVQLEGE